MSLRDISSLYHSLGLINDLQYDDIQIWHSLQYDDI